MNNCEYEKNGHCTLNECMYGDYMFIDDSAFDTGKHCMCNYELPSKFIDEMIKEQMNGTKRGGSSEYINNITFCNNSHVNNM